MNRNQKFGLAILLVIIATLVGSGYFIYKAQEEEDDYDGSYTHEGHEEVVADTTNYYPEEDDGIDSNEDKDSTLFTVVEQMPEFPGGEEAMNQFLNDNLQYPQMAKEQGIQGKVWIGFIVNKSGKITNVEVLRGIGGGCDEEAARVVKKMPDWKPGRQSGRPVKVKFRFPINFVLR